MKNKLQKTIIMLSKCFLYGLVLQTLMLNLVFALNANGQYKNIEEVRVTLSAEQLSLNQFFREVQRQTPFKFSYEYRDVDRQQSVTFAKKEGPVIDFLREAAQQSQLSFRQVNHGIDVVKKKESDVGVTVIDPITISGKVFDEKREPLPGTTITVLGSSSGTVTDIDGNYSITIPEGSTLVFSYIGYASKTVMVGAQSTVNVMLIEDQTSLDEYVVIGYGTQLRKNLSSSTSKVDVENVNFLGVNSFEAALQGMAAGVQVTQSSALAGSAVNIRIRGSSSVVASSEPLYVIDGIPVEAGAIGGSNPGQAANNWNLQTAANTNVLASLNPNDIESIEILKDAASAAIYGSRGSNGVVLITTKKGTVGKPKINVSSTFAISEPTRKIPLLNSQQYIELAQEAWVNSGNNLVDFWSRSGVLQNGLTEAEAKETNTNWVDETLRTGYLLDHNFSMSGGTEKTIYFISANLKNQKSILQGNDYRSYGFRLNLEHTANNIFSFGANMSMGHVNNNQVPTSWAGGVGHVNELLPIWPVYNSDGSYFRPRNNPVAQINLRDMNFKSNQFYGTWYVRARIAEGLMFRSEYGLNFLNNDDYHFRDGITLWTGRSSAATLIGNNVSWNWNNSLNYQKQFKGHNLDILLATEAQKSIRTENTALGEGFFNSATIYPQDAAIKILGYSQSGYSFNSYVSRINYDFKGKYLFSTSLRTDGSSRFAVNSRWGYFPAASIGYIISEEEYFRSLGNTLNFLKLRASYGVVGNAGIGNNTFTTNYNTATYNGNVGIFMSNLGDNRLGWEKTAQLDIGLTWGALNDRITGEIDYYYKRTDDLLLGYPVSALTGVDNITTNVGILTNRGVDISLNSVNVRKANFAWETKFNINFNENNIVEVLPGRAEGVTLNTWLGSTTLQPGLPVGISQMVVWKGVDSATGQDTYLEQETGNILTTGEINTNYGNFNNFWNENFIFTGNPWPRNTGGLWNGFSRKNWDLSFLFTWAVGQEYVFGDVKRYLDPFGGYKVNPPTHLLDRWQNPGDITNVSQVTTQNIQWGNTTEHLFRTDFLRLKDVNIGYTFSGSQNSILNGLRMSMRFSNLLTFTKAPDFFWDPEFTGVNFNNSSALGADKGAPQAKTYMLSVSWDF
ncbi:SusC/RagA family TonB-linked outer membrane protein [Cyclobacterium xiamenense]|uniref:SusC/RagA family TonB-linked outer membrane protein n=1 Tax=Cyclobacterium xiamenense TaxID=1297121 RepID=UPI0012B92859|nr:SusC/RagA family TonB-linked outer membrane protein [Cyclobacterium xiamenense]